MKGWNTLSALSQATGRYPEFGFREYGFWEYGGELSFYIPKIILARNFNHEQLYTVQIEIISGVGIGAADMMPENQPNMSSPCHLHWAYPHWALDWILSTCTNVNFGCHPGSKHLYEKVPGC